MLLAYLIATTFVTGALVFMAVQDGLGTIFTYGDLGDKLLLVLVFLLFIVGAYLTFNTGMDVAGLKIMVAPK